MPQIMRNDVVLPAPLGPSSPTISLCPTCRCTPSTTRRRPNDLTSPFASRMYMLVVLRDSSVSLVISKSDRIRLKLGKYGMGRYQG